MKLPYDGIEWSTLKHEQFDRILTFRRKRRRFIHKTPGINRIYQLSN